MFHRILWTTNLPEKNLLSFFCKCAWLGPGCEEAACPGLRHRHRHKGRHDQDGVGGQHRVIAMFIVTNIGDHNVVCNLVW